MASTSNKKIKIYLYLPIIFWLVLILCSLAWGMRTAGKDMTRMVFNIGHAFFKEIETTRLWNAEHGGVYVPVTDKTRPNPYLDIPDRDVITTTGIQLTKINPAYMTRQIAEIAKRENNITYHIASLKPIRPANKADKWETAALTAFENGRKEVLQFIEGATAYRYMAPLLIKKACLSCHAEQGYKTGDIRGGISVTIPAGAYLAAFQDIRNRLTLIHMLALLFGAGFFYFLSRYGNKQEQIIEQKNKELETVLNTVDSLVLVLDHAGRIVLFNRACENATGYAFDEIRDEYVWDILIPVDEMAGVKKVFSSLKAGMFPNRHTNCWKTKNSGKILISWSNSALLDKNGAVELIVATGLDITERERSRAEKKKLELQLGQAQKMEAIGTLAGGIAHDFNNILAIILGYTDLAKDDAPPDSKFSQDLDKILQAGHRARDLVQQILAFSRQAHVEKIPLAPQPIIKEALKMLRSSIPATIEIRENIAPDCGAIDADPTQLHQILMNLCTNAFHAMEGKGGILKVGLKVADSVPGQLKKGKAAAARIFLELSISDSGHGIGPDIIDRIFDPFFTTKEKGRGTGMGLAITYGIVKKYGGAITVDSHLDAGTTFHVYLPQSRQGLVSTPSEEIAVPGGNERILFVDDEELLATASKDMLERLGYHVTAKQKSSDALEAFHNQPDKFDLVITDQTMPGMTGLDLAGKMLQIRPDIPIILCTGYSALVNEDVARAQGIREFVMKPLTKGAIAKLIRKVLDNKAVVK